MSLELYDFDYKILCLFLIEFVLLLQEINTFFNPLKRFFDFNPYPLTELLFLQENSPPLEHFPRLSQVKFINWNATLYYGLFVPYVTLKIALFLHWVVSEPVSKLHISAYFIVPLLSPLVSCSSEKVPRWDWMCNIFMG